MNELKQVYTRCDICGREIRYGNAVLEIQRNVEQHYYEEDTGQPEVTVIDADPLVTLCAGCGNSMANRKELWKILVKELGLPGPACDEDTAQQTVSRLPETCGCCGVELEIGKARVSLVRLIGQMDWSEQRDDGELSVIDGEDILSFCPACGNKMSTRRLQQALQRIIDDLGVPERMETGSGTQQPELHGTPQYPVKILHIAAEGGDITLYGWKGQSGEWLFSRDTTESALCCEDTHDLELHHVSDMTPGWHGAMELLNGNPWYRHVPVYVHPEFAEQTIEALRNVPKENQPDIRYNYWEAVCAGKKYGVGRQSYKNQFWG